MEKTKYEVWKSNRLSNVYVTEKRNVEDMLLHIIKQHQSFDEFNNPKPIKIIQIVEGERKTIYTARMYKFWEENLVV